MDANIYEFLMNHHFDDMNKNEIEDALINLPSEWQVQIWNDYCEKNNYCEEIFNNVKDNISDVTPNSEDLIEMIKGSYNYRDQYFYISEDNELISFNDLNENKNGERSPIYFEDLASWIEDVLA